MSNLVRSTQKHLATGGSVSGTAGKGLAVAGSGAIVLSMLASLIPFVGVFGLGVVFLLLGLFMWE